MAETQKFKAKEIVKVQIYPTFNTTGEILEYDESQEKYRILLYLGSREIQYFSEDKLSKIDE